MTDLDRIAKTEALFAEACQRNGFWVSPDGRIGATDVEKLLGWREGSFASRVRLGSAPPVYRIGGGGHKQTVRLTDLAAWFESHLIRDDVA